MIRIIDVACNLGDGTIHSLEGCGIQLCLELNPSTSEELLGHIAVQSYDCKNNTILPQVDMQIAVHIEDLHSFYNELEKAHKRMNGSARLKSYSGTVLCITYLEEDHMGRVAIGGKFVDDSADPKYQCQDNYRSSRNGWLEISFDGLLTDQSYIPSVLSMTAEFLRYCE